jgi:hypothetical protein
MKQQWLKDWPWETVVTINAGLCQEKKASHKTTSDGYEPAKKLWETSRKTDITLREVFDLCRQCHKLAPFCAYNGNTFAAIGRTLILDLLRKMSPMKAHTFRSVVGHYIAGTVDEDELSEALESFLPKDLK